MNNEWEPRAGLVDRIVRGLKPNRTPAEIERDLRKAAPRIRPDGGAYSHNIILAISGIYDFSPEMRSQMARELRDIGVRPQETLSFLLYCLKRYRYQPAQLTVCLKKRQSIPYILRVSERKGWNTTSLGSANPTMAKRIQGLLRLSTVTMERTDERYVQGQRPFRSS